MRAPGRRSRTGRRPRVERGLRGRLALVAMAVVGVAAMLLAAGTGYYPQRPRTLDAVLQREAAALVAPASDYLLDASDAVAAERELRLAALRSGFLVVVTRGDRVLLRTGRTLVGLPPSQDTDAPSGTATRVGGGGILRWRVATTSLSGAARLQVMVPYLPLGPAMVPIRRQAVGPTVLAVLLAGLAAWAASGRLLRARANRESDTGHELRTPLTSLRAHLDLLRRPELDAEERTAVAEAADRDAARLHALVDQLQGEPDVPTVDPVELVDVVCVDARIRHPDATIELDLPTEPVVVGVPAATLHSVVENLVENALKHGAGRVGVMLRADATALELTVDDDGPGIPLRDRAFVLRRFRRGSTAAAGSGIGLALVRERVAVQGGRLHLGASPLGGAQLRVRLPVARR